MMIMVGAFLGWPRTILTIFIAALFGSLIGIAVIKLRGGTMRTEIPFGVFLGPAGIAALLFGHELIAWYTSLYRY
jgi:leader peptidase (prepilin peptidase)/N-methyltransferase